MGCYQNHDLERIAMALEPAIMLQQLRKTIVIITYYCIMGLEIINSISYD